MKLWESLVFTVRGVFPVNFVQMMAYFMTWISLIFSNFLWKTSSKLFFDIVEAIFIMFNLMKQ